jgi:hypothetical protein
MTHPTKDWQFDDTIEEEFQKWFNDDSWMEICGGFSFRWKWFQFTLNFMNFRPRNLDWYREDHERYEDID